MIAGNDDIVFVTGAHFTNRITRVLFDYKTGGISPLTLPEEADLANKPMPDYLLLVLELTETGFPTALFYSEDFLRLLLDNGHPLVVVSNFTDASHEIKIIDYDEERKLFIGQTSHGSIGAVVFRVYVTVNPATSCIWVAPIHE